jgi:tetratricopeptide (TPR) repeat protein
MQARFTRLAALVLALSVAVAGCGKYSISNIRSAKAFQDATALYTQQDYKGAAPLYEKSVSLNPDLGFAYFFLGNSYDNMYKPAKKDDPDNQALLEKAAKNYRIAIEKLATTTNPKELEVRRNAFEYLIALYGTDKLNDFSKAESTARELIAVDPSDSATYRILAKLYEDQGRFDDAEKEFNAAIQARPNEALGYQLLAGFYNRQGNFDKTIETFNKRAAIEPKNPEAWQTIGAFYQDKVFRDKSLPRATALQYTLKGLENVDKAIALSPEYFEAVLYKNILLKQQALYEKDPAKQKALLAESDVLYKKALDIKAKQQGATVSAETPKSTTKPGKGGK